MDKPDPNAPLIHVAINVPRTADGSSFELAIGCDPSPTFLLALAEAFTVNFHYILADALAYTIDPGKHERDTNPAVKAA